ncbi:hypothetical protein MKX01_020747 [Papaver californicum]|nr:hypothetical protein MKX01_020747 [Papaver californicum]
MASSSTAKKSKGHRPKIEMKMLEKESARELTFARRIPRIVKLTRELHTLYGAEVALISFPPAGKLFSYGNPSVIDRYLSDANDTSKDAVITAQHDATIAELNVEYNEALKRLEDAKKRGKELAELRKAYSSEHLWNRPIDELSLEELERLRLCLDDLKIQVKEGHPELFLSSSVASSLTSSQNVPRGL